MKIETYKKRYKISAVRPESVAINFTGRPVYIAYQGSGESEYEVGRGHDEQSAIKNAVKTIKFFEHAPKM